MIVEAEQRVQRITPKPRQRARLPLLFESSDRVGRDGRAFSVGVDFCRYFFLRKRTHAKVLNRPVSPDGSRGRRMTDESTQIAATSPARRRALARMRRCERASGTRRSEASGIRVATGSENYRPCKALKTHKMGKDSRFCASPLLGPAERVARGREGAARGPSLPTIRAFWTRLERLRVSSTGRRRLDSRGEIFRLATS
jgi:hypothetical protein